MMLDPGKLTIIIKLAWWYMSMLPVLGRQRQHDLWGSLARKFTLTDNSQVLVRDLVSNNEVGDDRGRYPTLIPSLHACIHGHAHSHTHVHVCMHTHIYTHNLSTGSSFCFMHSL